MSRKNNSIEIILAPKNQAYPKRKKIDFIPNDAVKRVWKNNHSDINELKSYLNPRGKKY